jgi:protein-disulfide isomerase
MSDGLLTPPLGKTDHVAGAATAMVVLVEYGDFECPYCGLAYPILKRIQQTLGSELRLVFRHFPLKEIHPHAVHAAEASEAAADRGRFWEMHDRLFEHQSALEDGDLVRYANDIGMTGASVARALATGTYARAVREHFLSGVLSGVNGTPTFFINGHRYDGSWQNERDFIAALRSSLATT